MLTLAQTSTRYVWPTEPLDAARGWVPEPTDGGLWRRMPEDPADVALDSRWPAFFPSPICLVTTGGGDRVALEKVVGASIVNRFPYIVALSFCIEDLSDRHYARRGFCSMLEETGVAAVQFLAPGDRLERVMSTIAEVPDERVTERIAATGLPVRRAIGSDVAVFDDAYMVYEARLVDPAIDFEGLPIYDKPWTDVGSHRIYYLKINRVQLRQDIAEGASQIRWRGLPAFEPDSEIGVDRTVDRVTSKAYTKRYTPNYAFPTAGTIGFAADEVRGGMAVKEIRDALITDNDDARWPCFFPQSAGIITSRSPEGVDNVMPCGSTTIVSRHPLVIAPCISYAAVNDRYALRESLDFILRSGWFGCGVPFIDDRVVDAIRYAGNLSLRDDAQKLRNSGLIARSGERVPVLTDLPLFYECKVVGAERLGTHVILFGEVQRIRARADLTPGNPLEWCPWADVLPADEQA